jgi:diketogulonate reductase-like aldo/keto reductase
VTIENWNRRDVIAAGLAAGLWPGIAWATENAMMMSKVIPGRGEPLPIIGLGTYEVFDVASTPEEIALRREIVDLLVARGGSLLDTSPMYNRSEKVIGDIIRAGTDRTPLFLATKVWADGREAGLRQMQRSAELMQADVIDLMQVHNLRDTAVHMQAIRELQDAGRIRYSGLTHYAAQAHGELAREMRKFKPDFIQINYSLGERDAEERLLPMAQDEGVAVLINRPFQAGRLFAAVSGRALPEWAGEFAASWGQFFLKFIVSHPAVTCVIPATSKLTHMVDNLGAGAGTLPDSAMRKRMVAYIADL